MYFLFLYLAAAGYIAEVPVPDPIPSMKRSNFKRYLCTISLQKKGSPIRLLESKSQSKELGRGPSEIVSTF
jgi:hypothetical protein